LSFLIQDKNFQKKRLLAGHEFIRSKMESGISAVYFIKDAGE
jgi:hypothetical protein